MLPKAKVAIIDAEVFPNKWEDCKTLTKSFDGPMVKGNAKFTAFSWFTSGGGALAVLDNANPKRLENIFPMIRGHTGPVLDFEFNPFNDNMVITGSEDCTIKVWSLPDKITVDLIDPKATIYVDKRVNLLEHHPLISGIFASGTQAENCVRVWDVTKSTSTLCFPGAGDSFSSIDWHPAGTQIAAASRDKVLRIGDTKSGQWTHEFKPHDGLKAPRMLFLGNTNHVYTVGFNKNGEREHTIHDINKLNEPLFKAKVDAQAGFLFPVWDPETAVLYLSPIGENSFKFFGLNSGKLEPLHPWDSGSTTVGSGAYPRKVLDGSKGEIMRYGKINQKKELEIISFRNPAKMTVTYSQQPQPKPTVQTTTTTSYIPTTTTTTTKVEETKVNEGPRLFTLSPHTTTTTYMSETDTLKAEVAKLKQRVQELENENAELKKKVK